MSESLDYLSLLSGYVDIGTVLFGIVLTQFIRYFLPSPEGSTSKFNVGAVAYRTLPFLPLLIGAATVVLKDGLITPTMPIDEAVIKGCVSGSVAAWLYRTAKIQIFGKGADSKDAGEEEQKVTTEEAKGLIEKAKELIK